MDGRERTRHTSTFQIINNFVILKHTPKLTSTPLRQSHTQIDMFRFFSLHHKQRHTIQLVASIFWCYCSLGFSINKHFCSYPLIYTGCVRCHSWLMEIDINSGEGETGIPKFSVNGRDGFRGYVTAVVTYSVFLST